ncbi:hypothetical protein DRQ15_02230 [candidate division KSB1 bacterium]|nr:MAG: hypothetical protein DRQ12_12825 [candidate division KSB1 bacterium]RKY88856.1 MAG: hypothetical protein DRQ11_02515 [candidate division KSB1 bacterium]RKY92477.1 MAG: hypothetical protein DRQ15_02230 [candidate division KSB1 bacterium]
MNLLRLVIILVLGYGVGIFGVDLFIRTITRRVLSFEQDAELHELIRDSIKNISRYIGWVERFLILTLTLTGNYSGIGLVLAAKGLLRLGNNRKFVEYVIFGTLLSFSLAFALGIIMRLLLQLPLSGELP